MVKNHSSFRETPSTIFYRPLAFLARAIGDYSHKKLMFCPDL